MYETGRIPREGIMGIWDRAINLVERIPMDVIQFACRVGIGGVFLKSAFTKTTEPWSLTLGDQTAMLFEYEYQLPVIPPDIAAYLATYAEYALGTAMILGVASRFSATGLLVMTAVIQFFVYPHLWHTHLLWAGALLLIIAKGPGRLSLDWGIAKVLKER